MSQSLKEKLETIRTLADECLAELGSPTPTAKKSHKVVSKKADEVESDIVLKIVNKVGDCDETALIQKYVLDQRGVEGRILLPFYVAQKYFNNAWLTSGDIARITSDLGVKIHKNNASNYLVEYRKYLESSAVRKSGQPTPYRLNRGGAKRFEEIISEKAHKNSK